MESQSHITMKQHNVLRTQVILTEIKQLSIKYIIVSAH